MAGTPLHIRKILGQQTGKAPQSQDYRANNPEAYTLLKMIGSVDWKAYVSDWEEIFLNDMYGKAVANGASSLNVTGRQLFRLRDIKDKLVEKGIL